MTGERIKQVRVFRRYKQQEVASILGITQQAYSSIEGSDNMTLDTLNKVCAVLHVLPIFILDTLPITPDSITFYGNESLHSIIKKYNG